MPWSEYRDTWATDHGLHTGSRLLHALDTRFGRVDVGTIPYYFSQLADDVTADDERAAVASGALAAAAFRYVGKPH